MFHVGEASENRRWWACIVAFFPFHISFVLIIVNTLGINVLHPRVSFTAPFCSVTEWESDSHGDAWMKVGADAHCNFHFPLLAVTCLLLAFIKRIISGIWTFQVKQPVTIIHVIVENVGRAENWVGIIIKNIIYCGLLAICHLSFQNRYKHTFTL